MDSTKNKEHVHDENCNHDHDHGHSHSHSHEEVHIHGPHCNHHHHALAPITRSAPKVGRNDPCSCGSNQKFKKCCGK